MKISELLKQADITLTPGDYLASITESAGYIPDYRGNTAFHLGQYLYKIVGVGQPDGTTGLYASLNIVPVAKSADGQSWVDVLDQPIIVQVPGQVSYMTGRNNIEFGDVYNGYQYHIKENIASGEEHRNILLAFRDFVESEFEVGVNIFTIEGPEYLDETP